MKKIVLMLLLFASFKVGAQSITLTVNNNTPFLLYGNVNGSNGPCSASSWGSTTTLLGTSTISFAANNTTTITVTAGSLPTGFVGSMPAANAQFNFLTIPIFNATPFGTSCGGTIDPMNVGETCAGFTASYTTSCYASNYFNPPTIISPIPMHYFTATWTNTGGNITVDIN